MVNLSRAVLLLMTLSQRDTWNPIQKWKCCGGRRQVKINGLMHML